jgi:crossover junction endodeoxyribonuclease RusA
MPMVERTGSLALPIDFVISGVPVSVQSRATAAMDRWHLAVAAAARAARPRRRGGYDASAGRLAVTLVYFYLTPPLDTDNMIKPILDAMRGIVYEDDKQIVDLHAGIREMRGAYDLSEVSDVLWSAIDAGDPFVYVHVDAAPEPLEALP